jgi:hypothetical protein
MQLLFLHRQPVLCAKILAEDSEIEPAPYMDPLKMGPDLALAAGPDPAVFPAAARLGGEAFDVVAAVAAAAASVVATGSGFTGTLLYLVSKAVGFLARTIRCASLRIFSHRGMLQHSRHRHCVPQYIFAPKHWQ